MQQGLSELFLGLQPGSVLELRCADLLLLLAGNEGCHRATLATHDLHQFCLRKDLLIFLDQILPVLQGGIYQDDWHARAIVLCPPDEKLTRLAELEGSTAY